MFATRLHTFRSLSRICTRFSSSIQQSTGAGTPSRSYKLQFSKSKLTEFGDLPQGEIPEALKYDRLVKQTQLENGVRIVTEKWNSPLASVCVLVQAGSRNETPENSGVSTFLERLNLRGTQSQTREQIEQQIDSFGGQLSVKTGREQQTYTLTFLPNQVENAISFLGDLLNNSLYTSASVEAEKDAIYRASIDSSDQSKVVIESAHYTSYRDHYLGQPVNGIRENIVNITSDHLKEFQKKFYVGPNFIVTGAGNLDHDTFVNATEKAFGGLSSQAPVDVPNIEEPQFTPSIISMRDDELNNLNVGTFFKAPTLSDPEGLSLYMLTKILGDYRADRFTGAHLNNSDRQYNQMHAVLGNLPDVTIHRSLYIPYKDTALFGNYFMGNEVYAMQMAFAGQMILTEYASYMNPVEVFRARAKIFNELISEDITSKSSYGIAQQVLHFGRRIPRSEFARRISSIDAAHLSKVSTRNFWDKDLSVVLWGPTHMLQGIAHYGRPWRRSTLGQWAYHYFQQ